VYTAGGKLFLGLRVGDSVDDYVHMLKENHQRETLLGREVRPILLDVLLNVRTPILMLGNAMCKNVE
jgi:hypothetical protein